jgi:short-subunit dehydrogenase
MADMTLPLHDAVTVITGAASGIGRATALAFARRGSHLALTDRDAEELARTAAQASELGVSVSRHAMDVTDGAAVAALPSEVVDAHGRVTVLINNAGVTLIGRFADTSLDEFRWLTDINLHAVVAHTHAFLPALRTQPAAQIGIVSSMFGLIGPPGQVAYATAKFAVRGFGEALRHELTGTGVGVTIAHPGGIATAIARRARIVAGADQAAARAQADAFDRRALRIDPDIAGARIARGVARRRSRVLIGADARIADAVQRLSPGRYWAMLGRAYR